MIDFVGLRTYVLLAALVVSVPNYGCSTIPNKSSMTKKQALQQVDEEIVRIQNHLGVDLDWKEVSEGTVDGCEGLSGPTEWRKLHRVFVIDGLDPDRGREAMNEFDQAFPREFERTGVRDISISVRKGKFSYQLAYYTETQKLRLIGTTPCIR
jgi:hypothetical protein